MKRFLLGIFGGILGGLLAVGSLPWANNNRYVGYNPATGVNGLTTSLRHRRSPSVAARSPRLSASMAAPMSAS